jgi:hypothetical protein
MIGLTGEQHDGPVRHGAEHRKDHAPHHPGEGWDQQEQLGAVRDEVGGLAEDVAVDQEQEEELQRGERGVRGSYSLEDPPDGHSNHEVSWR